MQSQILGAKAKLVSLAGDKQTDASQDGMQELFEQALESETREDLSPLLPPLFGEKPEVQSPFQISGRLISNERVDDYWDSIEGAELQFEFKQ